MTTKRLFLSALCVCAFAACDDNTSSDAGADSSSVARDMTAAQGDMTGSHADMTTPSFPAAPTVGAQIDRLGRPGINTALTDPFWNNGTGTVDQHHMKQDAYNAGDNPSTWASLMIGGKTVLAIFEANLAAYDGLDTGLASAPNTCGNQFGFGGPLGAAYTTLATVLADDQLYLDTSTTTCSQYLGVEVKTLVPSAAADCGGRTLTENVIDTTYNVLAIGTLTGPVTNGITSDAAGTETNAVFPYLGAPN